jgi:hypothetical protein
MATTVGTAAVAATATTTGAVLARGSSALGPSRAFSCDVRREIVAAGRAWATAQNRLVHLAVDLDRSGTWAFDGSRICAHWIAAALDIEICTAREWLRIGRALEQLPIIDAAFAARQLSYSKVRLLTRIATPDTETELTAIAERTPAGRLAREIARWLAGREEPEDTERRHHEARSLTWHTEPDGMVVATLRLPPHVAAIPRVAIDTWIMRRTSLADPADPSLTESGEHASADAASTPSVTRWPSVAQQRADGMVALLRGGHRGSGGQDGGALVDTEVVLHVRGDGCTLDDGTPIAGSVVDRIAPESFISVLIHDAQRHPLNATGRHRHPTRRQKRVVHERDRGCVDCGTTELLQHDHVPDFTTTKRTLVDELEERCWPCHRARHDQQRDST